MHEFSPCMVIGYTDWYCLQYRYSMGIHWVKAEEKVSKHALLYTIEKIALHYPSKSEGKSAREVCPTGKTLSAKDSYQSTNRVKMLDLNPPLVAFWVRFATKLAPLRIELMTDII